MSHNSAASHNQPEAVTPRHPWGEQSVLIQPPATTAGSCAALPRPTMLNAVAMAPSAAAMMAEKAIRVPGVMSPHALPRSRAPIQPGNVAQLLSDEHFRDRELRQALWCGAPVTVPPPRIGAVLEASPSLLEWAEQLERLSEGQQPQWSAALEEIVIPPSDPRRGLVGQRGVCVSGHHTVPAGAILLHYAGTVRTEEEFEDIYTPEEGLRNGFVFLLAGVVRAAAAPVARCTWLQPSRSGN